MSRPLLLDLFCGAGGAAVGYHRAGFDVIGVDIAPQPRYPFDFVQWDAMDFPLTGFDKYDVIDASPPCQAYSAMTTCRPGLAATYAALIDPLRERLRTWGGPYVIENVVGAPLINPIELCGLTFGLTTYRHRLFESNVAISAPPHQDHVTPTSKAGHWVPGTFISIAGHCAPMHMARAAMGIDWMNRDELVEAIPPAYTEHIGRQLMAALA